ncbi:hypothetical protein H4219_003882 [Mycoemilia scoparia]|uniref:histidine--tRNA ligase n=1 Tax=Mycoemilia scoparia TaxID=417184 RepID=A0A9W7ZTF9_9FUNG|nr:hypothetical protein H4219_003882 [Mycoemilia scoparia]
MDAAEKTCKLYGYKEVQTPVLEHISVFKRSLGDQTDVIGKELYSFLDKNSEEVVMRPEGTAGVTRAVVAANLHNQLPQKLYYQGPMFRHERPQKGRLRQFNQIGIEAFGYAHPSFDVECIAMGIRFLRKLGLGDKIKLKINSLGNQSTMQSYKSALCNYLKDYKEKLSIDSQRRLETNPLRILDSKCPDDQKILSNAPAMEEYLDTKSSDRFKQVLGGLDALSLPYIRDSGLVRGLDYYKDTVWEAVYDEGGSALGESQSTILAGGRYDGLLGAFGGPQDVPCIGWAAGVERLSMCISDSVLPEKVPNIPILIIPDEPAANSEADQNPAGKSRRVNPAVAHYATSVGELLRENGYHVFTHYPKCDLDGNHVALTKQLGKLQAGSLGVAILIGSEECLKKRLILRDLSARSQNVCGIDDLLDKLDQL